MSVDSLCISQGAPPPPATVTGNVWTDIAAPELDGWEPTRSVTVVVPYYEAPRGLAVTMAGLARQTYAAHLFEVVVADDGSAVSPELPRELPFPARVVRQERRGFGLARARNTGAAAAEGEILVFLDCDMVPERDWLAAHARWHHTVCDALTLGFRKHADFEGIEPQDLSAMADGEGLDALLAGRDQERPEWIESHMIRTNSLTSDHDDLFRVVTGGNLGVRRETFERLGGFDETFEQWGAEDIEFGYRVFTTGGLLIPERSGACWHQGLGTNPDANEQRSLEEQRAKIAHLIAEPSFRQHRAGRSYSVPYFTVSIAVVHEPAEQVVEVVESILANDFHDVVICLSVVEEHPGRVWIERQFSGDPRVEVGTEVDAEDLHPFAAVRVSVAADTLFSPTTLGAIRSQLLHAPLARLELDHPASDHVMAVRAAKTRALSRHRRIRGSYGRETADELVPTRRLDGSKIGLRSSWSHERARGSFRSRRGAVLRSTSPSSDGRERSLTGKVVRRLTDVRDRTSAVELLRWVITGLRARVRVRVRALLWRVPAPLRRSFPVQALLAATGTHARRRSAPQGADVRAGFGREHAIVPTGLRVHFVGERAVEALGQGVRHHRGPIEETGPDRPDVVVVSGDGEWGDDLECSVPVIEVDEHRIARPEAPARRLAGYEALVPVDVGMFNPRSFSYFAPARRAAVGCRVDGSIFRAGRSNNAARAWGVSRRDVFDLSACPTILTPRARLLAQPRRLVQVLSGYEAVVVPRSLFPSAESRAVHVARLASAGLPLLVDDLDQETAELLGPDMVSALRGLEDAALDDPNERERWSVRLRREALRTHSIGQRWRALAGALGIAELHPPAVSVTLATNRPEWVHHAVRQAAAQTYPNFELVLALHGDRFPSGIEDELVAASNRVRTLRVPEAASLGEALNRAVEAASGEVVTKWDDDDWYGPEHLWDLVLALEYSAADLVGKAAEFVYLAESDRTIRRFVGRAEAPSFTLAGGTLAMRRSALRELGGWRRIPSRVDQALIADVNAAGGDVYRTHGFGYVLHRHGNRHTWDAGDDYFLEQAAAVQPGLALEFADAVHEV